MDNMEILDAFNIQYQQLIEYLRHKIKIRIGTLGPKGTTSYFATKYFINCIKEFCFIEVEIVLRNNFDLVNEDLLEERVDIIVIPNAYEKITTMYWNTKLKHIFSFLLNTPYYGLATKTGNMNTKKQGEIKISTCSPVVCLVEQFVKEIDKLEDEYKVIFAESTTDAAEMVNKGIVDYAVTNETSLSHTGLEFVSSKHKAEVLWSVFCLNKNTRIVK